jgi:hypothetical protein
MTGLQNTPYTLTGSQSTTSKQQIQQHELHEGMGPNSHLYLSLLHINLPSMITDNQLSLSISCFKLVALRLVINDHF